MIETYVNGKTGILGVIGNPISHTFSPYIHNSLAKRVDNNFVYLPFHVVTGMIKDAIHGAYALNVKGLNITVPYKKDVMPFLCHIDKKAEAAGAVNTLKYTKNGYEGYNTDIIGVTNTFLYSDINMTDKDALVLGAGGSACAVVIALCEMGAKKIYIANRTLETAKSLAERINKYYQTHIECITYDEIKNIDSVEAFVQTTTLGFGEQKHLSPITDNSLFKKTNFAFDLIYSPWETLFLKDAKENGCKAVNGFDMLVFQAIAAYEIWTEQEIDKTLVQDLKAELVEYLLR